MQGMRDAKPPSLVPPTVQGMKTEKENLSMTESSHSIHGEKKKKLKLEGGKKKVNPAEVHVAARHSGRFSPTL